MGIVGLLTAILFWLIPTVVFFVCVYFIVKAAVKAALREYAKEKEENFKQF